MDILNSVSPRRQIVVLTHVVPKEHAGNAGQNYQSGQVRYWQRGSDVTCILVPGRSADTELHEAVSPCVVLSPAKLGGNVQTLLRRFRQRVQQPILGAPYPNLKLALLQDERSRHMLATADTVVLQWQDKAIFAPLVRRLNPSAHIVGVLHDVVPQSLRRQRRRASNMRAWLRLAISEAFARINDWRIMQSCDAVIVLSEKDARLLPSGKAAVHIVPPVIRAPLDPRRVPVAGRVLMVAGWRREDIDGLRWFASDVLPRLKQAGCSPEVHLVGKLAPEYSQEFLRQGMTARGYVDDLAAEYAAAGAVIVPLRLGAGVKFKTVEAIFHRVPLVTTSVGAEGITGIEEDSDVASSAEDFAARLVQILSHPQEAQATADELFARVHPNHNQHAFEAALQAVLPSE